MEGQVNPGLFIFWVISSGFASMILFLVVVFIVESLKPKPPVVAFGPRQNLVHQRIDHPFTFHLQRKRRRPRMPPRLGPRQNLLLQQRIDDKKFIKNAIRTGIIHKDFEKWLRD